MAEGLEGLYEVRGVKCEAGVILDEAQGLPGAVEAGVEDAEGFGGHRAEGSRRAELTTDNPGRRLAAFPRASASTGSPSP